MVRLIQEIRILPPIPFLKLVFLYIFCSSYFFSIVAKKIARSINLRLLLN